ncbi:substrate-binding domain-containing protein [Microbacterium ulmi]|uniref:Sugar-binding protein n=1 Tax=Microbacterium ulmi TaxID=179095 RepID=A0A7Y2Q1K7_9MICO|nr:sugar-binding protein [Microbacterium ulmi]NII69358.1 putative multiple sugar transport system substrate-binding protein [Microbacterium ulmi]NNH04030.1 sugar-binding protein [Microbacterium ulmi]
MRKKLLAAGLAAVLLAGALAGCSSRNSDSGSGAEDTVIQKGDTVGVILPTKTSENVANFETYWNEALAEAGFKADIHYAANSNPVPDQQSALQGMITKGIKVIAIAAQDSAQMGAQLKQAKDAGVTIIAWDRLLLNTQDVDYYVSFNNFVVGEQQAQSLLEGLKSKKQEGPWNIELFAGGATDNNATVFFNGAMSVLQPLIDSGELVVLSGQTSFQQVNTEGWLAQKAQQRMANLITSTYESGTELDGVLSPNDTLARAIITALQQGGLSGQIVTGQDGDVASVPLILDGTQYSTVYKDNRQEAIEAVKVISALAAGEDPVAVTDDPDNSDNGVKVVPAVLVTSTLVTAKNAAEAFKDNPSLSKAVAEATE